MRSIQNQIRQPGEALISLVSVTYNMDYYTHEATNAMLKFSLSREEHYYLRATSQIEKNLNGITEVKVVTSVSDGCKLLGILKKQKADIIFMDIKLPETNGIELTKIVKEKYPDIIIIALSMFVEVKYFNRMMEAGAEGFLLKNTQENEPADAIKAVLKC